MRTLARFVIVSGALLTACVSTDYIVDPVMVKAALVLISPEMQALEVGNNAKFQAIYIDSLATLFQDSPLRLRG